MAKTEEQKQDELGTQLIQAEANPNAIAEVSLRLILDENSNEKLQVLVSGGTQGLSSLTSKLISTEDPFMLIKGTMATIKAISENYLKSISEAKKKRKPRTPKSNSPEKE